MHSEIIMLVAQYKRVRIVSWKHYIFIVFSRIAVRKKSKKNVLDLFMTNQSAKKYYLQGSYESYFKVI